VARSGYNPSGASPPDGESQVPEATNGAEAVALFEAHRPDVVLIDLRMPRLDGIVHLDE
jgi:CheY-like chemotaxis protein